MRSPIFQYSYGFAPNRYLMLVTIWLDEQRQWSRGVIADRKPNSRLSTALFKA